MTERLVVIGGDAAGMSAASQARRRRGPDDLEIVAFERGNYTSYSACGIPYFIGEVVTEFDSLIARAPEVFRDKYAIDARTRVEIDEIDLDRGAVHVHDLERDDDSWEGFDQLVIATGAVPNRPRMENSSAEGIFGVQVLDDGVAIKAAVEKEHPKNAVVVGGGYIGLEMAEAFVKRGISVTLVDAGPQPMPTLDPDMGVLVADAMRGMGIQVLTNEPVAGFECDGDHVSAVVTATRSLPADIVALGLGARPNSELARSAGILTGVTGGIVVDRRMHTGIQGVWAAGDCTEKFHIVARKPVAISLGTHANKEGRVAGINIGGGYATFPGVVGTAVSKVCDLEIARTGLKETEAEMAGYRYVTATVDSTTRAGYFPGAAPIKTKLIAEQRSGRLLGAQIIGKEGAAKRIDVLAAALWNEMTVDEMLNMDLSYAPPFSPVWDPVLIAARKAWEKVEAQQHV
ncbi:MAG: FAD-dependent oxidoreductase [Actinomycetota bacterium]|nr:FAD-dependent oxidoreductase [Actinomycetota bacterium]